LAFLVVIPHSQRYCGQVQKYVFGAYLGEADTTFRRSEYPAVHWMAKSCTTSTTESVTIGGKSPGRQHLTSTGVCGGRIRHRTILRRRSGAIVSQVTYQNVAGPRLKCRRSAFWGRTATLIGHRKHKPSQFRTFLHTCDISHRHLRRLTLTPPAMMPEYKHRVLHLIR